MSVALALSVIGAAGDLMRAQTGPAEYSRQSDVIYGRKFGLALTMEVFAPAKPNGLGHEQNVLRMLRELSPVTDVTAGDPPTMLIRGDADKAVPLQQSRRLIDRLHEANVAARLVVREGMAHARSGSEADSALIAEWFDALAS